jgi:lipopolysaccharide transport system ATP-binding protein
MWEGASAGDRWLRAVAGVTSATAVSSDVTTRAMVRMVRLSASRDESSSALLTVGDVEFQKKCLGKMDSVTKEGRTILFVSHNMAAVKRLCQSRIMLGSGKVVRMGETEALVDDYLSTHQETRSYENLAISEAPICLRKMELHSNEGDLLQRTIEAKDGFVVYLEYEINRPLQGVHAFLRIHLPDGETLFSSGDTDTRPDRIGWRTPGSYKCELSIPPKILNEGIYTITWSAGVPHQINYDVKFHIISFRIIDNTSSRMDYVHERRPGYLALDLDWNYLDRDPASN